MQISVVTPFPFESIPRIWAWIAPFKEKVSDDFGPATLSEFVTHMAASWERQKTWAIYGDGELGGLITFERVSPWLGSAHMVLKPDLQGKGIGVKALRETFRQMFEESGIGKLSFFVLGGNLAVGSLVHNLGATREGTLREHTLTGGKPRDVWVYGLTKTAFEGKHHVIPVPTDHSNIDKQQPAAADQ